MPIPREILERRAIKAGVKASRKRHHLVSEEELLSLRVQTMPAWLRISLFLSGICLIVAACYDWPSHSNSVQALEVISGIFAMLIGAFGIRRTLSHILDSFNGIDLVSTVLDAVGEAVSNVDL